MNKIFSKPNKQTHTRSFAFSVASALAIAAISTFLVGASSGQLRHISIVGSEADAVQANATSEDIVISENGEWIAFESSATNFGITDTNSSDDVFMRNLITGEIVLASNAGTTASPAAGNSGAYDPSLSEDGRYVAFESSATNLVTGVTAGNDQVYVFDRVNGTIEHVSRGGTEASPIIADMNASNPEITSDGRYVAFVTAAGNMNPQDTNGQQDAYVFDRETHTLERVSEGGTALSPIEISDGSCTSRVSLSGDGRYAVFGLCEDMDAIDTNGGDDAYLFDRQTHELQIVSIGGTESSPVIGNGSLTSPKVRISDDGNVIVFAHNSTNLIAGITNGNEQLYVFERDTNTLEHVSVGGATGADGDTGAPRLSEDGRYVVFESSATDLVSGDANGYDDVFLYDRQTKTTTLLSISGSTTGNDRSEDPYITPDATCIVFESEADNFLTSDVNGDDEDLFLVNGPNGSCAGPGDNDGSNDVVEDAAPNSGDANNDGTPDSEQRDVTSLISPVTNEYVVLEAGGVCSANESVLIEQESTVETKDDDTYDYPVGLLDFTLSGCSVGGSETITQYYYGDYDADTMVLRKYNPTNDTYTTIDGASLTQITIGGETAIRASYTVVDGGNLDADGTANGTIVDPVGLGVLAEITPGAPDTGIAPTSILPLVSALIIGMSAIGAGAYVHERKA